MKNSSIFKSVLFKKNNIIHRTVIVVPQKEPLICRWIRGASWLATYTYLLLLALAAPCAQQDGRAGDRLVLPQGASPGRGGVTTERGRLPGQERAGSLSPFFPSLLTLQSSRASF